MKRLGYILAASLMILAGTARGADPNMFGDANTFTSAMGTRAYTYMAGPWAAPSSGTLGKFWFYATNSYAVTAANTCGVYDSNGTDSARNLLAKTAEIVSTRNTWASADLAAVDANIGLSIEGGHYYWFAFACPAVGYPGNTGNVGTTTGNKKTGYNNGWSYSAGNMPTFLGYTVSSTTTACSIYVTYTPSGGATPAKTKILPILQEQQRRRMSMLDPRESPFRLTLAAIYPRLRVFERRAA